MGGGSYRKSPHFPLPCSREEGWGWKGKEERDGRTKGAQEREGGRRDGET